MDKGSIRLSKARYNSKAALISLPNWVPIEVASNGCFEVETGTKDSLHHYTANYLWGKDVSLQQMPVLIQGNGTPWDLGNLYLMHIIERTLEIRRTVNMQTIRSKAAGLLDYLKWLEDSDNDPMFFPKKTFLRVTYQYNHSLHQQVSTGAISASTARKFINSISAFYRYLAKQPFIVGEKGFDNPPFEEQVTWIPIKNSIGRVRTVKSVSTDLSQSHQVRKKANLTDIIIDGGSLKPLEEKDQIILIKALMKSSNIEMRLIHFVALFTGARIQSICTLRLSHLINLPSSGVGYINIKAGRGTSIDTKGDKRQTIQIPLILIEMLRTYYQSQRALRRRIKFKNDFKDDNYIFLSQRGIPFYKSRYDEQLGRKLHQTRAPRDAASIREFVKTIRKDLQKTYPSFYYRFHDLRATFGMNLVNRCLQKIENGQMTYLEALEIVRTRLGHTSRETTETYLRYHTNISQSEKLQEDYESYLIKLMNEA